MMPTPLVIAHRGASAYLPENTIEAFRLAIEKYKVDMIEFDLRATRDAVPIVIHDERLERTTDGHGLVSDHTLEQIKKFDAGYQFDPKGRGEFPHRGQGLRIPTLEELLKAFPDQPLAIEIKEKSETFTRQVLGILEKYSAAERSIVGSKHHPVSRTMQNSFPAVRRFCSRRDILGILAEHHLEHKTSIDEMAVASIPIQFLGIRFDTKEWIGHLHKKEMRVFYWSITDPAVVKSLEEMGADGIVTDDPAVVNRVLKRPYGIDPTSA